MYPNLYYFLKDVFGVEWEGARFLNSFGFFVALAFIAGAIVLTKGLQRKEKQGFLFPKEEKRMFGQPATTTELLLNATYIPQGGETLDLNTHRSIEDKKSGKKAEDIRDHCTA